MAYGSVRLVPGVNVERTPTLNQTGISSGNLIRWRDGLVEKIGGWERFYPFSIGSIPRDLLAWQDINTVDHLAIGATASLSVITNGALQNITPQTTTTNTPPNFTATASSPIIQIEDTNISSPTTNNSVFIAVPVSVGGLVLQGLYPITANINTDTYQITADANATLSTTTHTVTITNANPGVVTWNTHGLLADAPVFFTTTGALPTNITPFKTYYVLAAGLGSNTFEIGATPGGTAINTTAGAQSGTQTAHANGGTVPIFTTTSGSPSVSVYEPNHGLSLGETAPFLVPTTVGGTTVSGTYLVQSVTDANTYTISVTPSASSSATAPMNGGNVEFIYYIAIGPQPANQPYGSGLYSGGAYGIGTTPSAGQGTPITATDWTQGNWGEILLSCPQGGGVYQWSPDSGFQTAQLVSGAPVSNNGIFLAMPYQILVCYGSSKTGVPNPLQVSWSSSGDFTDFVPTTINQAGNYQIPSGSTIVGGMQATQQGLIWTDIDLWSMQYIGPPFVFGFSKIMSGCGLIGSHARGILGNTVFWMSQEQMFVMPAGGAPSVLPCTVWDYIFQNLDTANAYKIRCAPNSAFGTIAWHFQSLSGGTGENDSYIEFNAVEKEWTYGQYPTTGRSAWIDQSLLGTPIGGTPSGLIYQHEVGYNGDGAAINPIFTTGYFVIGEGEDFCFIDQFIPDFKFGLQGGAQSATLLVTLYSVNYPSDTPRSYGPYTVTQARQQITTRLRGRQAALQVQSQDADSFWRLGNNRYRYAPDGRR